MNVRRWHANGPTLPGRTVMLPPGMVLERGGYGQGDRAGSAVRVLGLAVVALRTERPQCCYAPGRVYRHGTAHRRMLAADPRSPSRIQTARRLAPALGGVEFAPEREAGRCQVEHI